MVVHTAHRPTKALFYECSPLLFDPPPPGHRDHFSNSPNDVQSIPSNKQKPIPDIHR